MAETPDVIDLQEMASEFWLAVNGDPSEKIARLQGDQLTQETAPEVTLTAADGLSNVEAISEWSRQAASRYGAGFVYPALNYSAETKREGTKIKHEFTLGDISTAAEFDPATGLVTFEETDGYVADYTWFRLWSETMIVFLTVCRDQAESGVTI